FSSRRRHTRFSRDWSSDVCSSDLNRREGIEEMLKTKGLEIYRNSKIEVDIAIIGGGLSGMCAAIAAARNGSSVVLVHDRSRLGRSEERRVGKECRSGGGPSRKERE